MLFIYIALSLLLIITLTICCILLKRKSPSYTSEFDTLRNMSDDAKASILELRETVNTNAVVTKEVIAGHNENIAHSMQGIQQTVTDQINALRHDTAMQIQGMREENGRAIDVMLRANTDMNRQNIDNLRTISEMVTGEVKEMRDTVTHQITTIREDNSSTMKTVLDASRTFTEQSAKNTQSLTETVNREMKIMREDTQHQLDKIRHTVDEQLQNHLDRKLQESFRTVTEQLMAVQQGLGQMNALASDVGDLRKTLSNVKTRGIWGEVQLGAILSEILSPDQYEINIATVPRSTERVEFAIKLPGQGDGCVYLPIDSKFPGDTYNKLLDAYDSGQPDAVEAAWKSLETVLSAEAKDIHTKYVHVPDTTEFAIMFLPVEGLYAEAVKHGLIEKFQKKFKINIAGPTTMAALLNSLQMGFKTLQIQKQSSEVWKILQNTKSEFEKYAFVLNKVQERLKQTEDELETLVGVRTRVLTSKLAKIEQYSPDEMHEALPAISD